MNVRKCSRCGKNVSFSAARRKWVDGYDSWRCGKYDPNFPLRSHSPLQEGNAVTGQHKLEDLASAVRAIPPSTQSVVTEFLRRGIEVAKEGCLTDDQVIRIVDNWPDSCPAGRDKYLTSVGIKRHVQNTVTIPLFGLAATYPDGRHYGWSSGVDTQLQEFRAAVVGKLNRGSGYLALNPNQNRNADKFLVGPQRNITFDREALQKVLVAPGPMRVTDDGHVWISYEIDTTPHQAYYPGLRFFMLMPLGS